MGKKILVIEDELHISKLVKFILEKKGFEVLQAFGGKEGIGAAQIEKPDLIVLDVMMPNMDGFEAAKILSSENRTKNMPIIMLSSATQSKDKILGMKLGAKAYITKPFDKDDLIANITKHIKIN